jgi:DnaJ-class molecular chaperone
MYIRGFELGEAHCRKQIGRALKDAYREAAMRHHPDRGGSHDAMVAINNLYERLAEILGRPA